MDTAPRASNDPSGDLQAEPYLGRGRWGLPALDTGSATTKAGLYVLGHCRVVALDTRLATRARVLRDHPVGVRSPGRAYRKNPRCFSVMGSPAFSITCNKSSQTILLVRLEAFRSR